MEGRGTSGKQFRVHKFKPGERDAYEKYLNMFEESWNKGKKLNLM